MKRTLALSFTILMLTNSFAMAKTDKETGIDSDFTSGDVVAGENSETTALENREVDVSIDPTTVGVQKKSTKTSYTNTTLNLSEYAKAVNEAEWRPEAKINSAITLKLQALLDWNHASPGPIDGDWGMNSKKALRNFQMMHDLPITGRMDKKVWDLLTKNIPKNQPVLIGYTLTNADVKGPFASTPDGSEAKSKMKGLYYQNIQEMLAERFHMNVNYLKELNANKSFKAGETITVFNPGKPLQSKITRIVADKSEKILYIYHDKKLIATYPTTVGSSSTPSPTGTHKIVNRVKNPWYRASTSGGKVYMLPPGPNSPVGIAWLGLSKPSYGIHGSPIPEGISRQASHGCVRLTNWDVLELYANIDTGTMVEFK